MDAGAVIGLLRTLKHDFFNHLQVISGYLQLNKTSEGKEYIRRVVDEYGEFSKITRLSLPEAALALLLSRHEAVQKGIEMVFEVQTDLAGAGLPGEKAGFCLEAALAEAVFALLSPQVKQRQVKVCLKEEQGGYACLVDFFAGGAGREGEQRIKERIGEVNGCLAHHGGRAEFRVTGERGQILLYFPKR